MATVKIKVMTRTVMDHNQVVTRQFYHVRAGDGHGAYHWGSTMTESCWLLSDRDVREANVDKGNTGKIHEIEVRLPFALSVSENKMPWR